MSTHFSEDMSEKISIIMNRRGKNFTEFVLEAMESYIRGIQFTEQIRGTCGGWQQSDHKDLKDGAEDYIRKMRKGRKL